MRFRGLFWQIYISFLLVTVLAVIAITWYFTSLVRGFYLNETREKLEAQARIISVEFTDEIIEQRYTEVRNHVKRVSAVSDIRITIILPDGLVIADNRKDPAKMDNHRTRPEVLEARRQGIGSSLRFSDTVSKNLMYVAIPLKADGNNLQAYIRAAMPVSAIDDTLASIQRQISVAGIIIAVLTAIIGLIISRRISAPLERMITGVERFARGELDFRVSATSSNELRKLTDALNQMAGQINEKIRTIDRQKSENQAVLQSMAEGIIAVDYNERILILNKATNQLLNLNSNGAPGVHVKDVIKNNHLLKIITRTLHSDEMVEDEFVYKNSGSRYLQVHGTKLLNEDGITKGALLVLNDVTRMRRLEEVRRDFVANVSHEIRTPLTSIKGFVEALHDGAIQEPDTAKRFLNIIRKQSNRLNSIIEDLLSLASLEGDEAQSTISFDNKKVRKVIKGAIQVCQPTAKSKNITIEVDCPDDVRWRMNAPLFEQALVNLIENSIKYSPENTTVSINCEEKPEEFVVSVRDQGIGIANEHLSRIFERFYRVDKARSRKMGGTGLGLAIVKHIANVHGGHVEVDSKAGKGSVFSIHIPRNI